MSRSLVLTILFIIGVILGIYYVNNLIDERDKVSNQTIKRLETENYHLKLKYLKLESRYDSLLIAKDKTIVIIEEIERNKNDKKQEVEKLSDSSSVNYFLNYTNKYSGSRLNKDSIE